MRHIYAIIPYFGSGTFEGFGPNLFDRIRLYLRLNRFTKSSAGCAEPSCKDGIFAVKTIMIDGVRQPWYNTGTNQITVIGGQYAVA